jgi:hypothetical protein
MDSAPRLWKATGLSQNVDGTDCGPDELAALCERSPARRSSPSPAAWSATRSIFSAKEAAGDE